MVRPSWRQYFLNIAEAVAARSTCPRAKVGAVIVKNNRIIASGYNGSPTGTYHCEENGCLLENGHCVRVIHAEINAIMQAGMEARDAIMYLTHSPCSNCGKAIKQSGIKAVAFKHEYGC